MMASIFTIFLSFTTAVVLFLSSYVVYHIIIAPRFNPLRKLAGPPLKGSLDNHMSSVLE